MKPITLIILVEGSIMIRIAIATMIIMPMMCIAVGAQDAISFEISQRLTGEESLTKKLIIKYAMRGRAANRIQDIIYRGNMIMTGSDW